MILAIACFVPGIILLAASVFALFQGSFQVALVMLAIAAAFIGYGMFRIKKYKKTAPYGKARYKCKGISLYGLPQGECECILSVYKDRIVFKVNKNDSVLYADKITSALLKSSTELSSASAGSTVAGALLFGIPGAIIASRPKSKTEYIIIVNYLSGGESKAIAVSVDKMQKYDAENVVFYINKNMSNGTDTIL